MTIVNKIVANNGLTGNDVATMLAHPDAPNGVDFGEAILIYSDGSGTRFVGITLPAGDYSAYAFVRISWRSPGGLRDHWDFVPAAGTTVLGPEGAVLGRCAGTIPWYGLNPVDTSGRMGSSLALKRATEAVIATVVSVAITGEAAGGNHEAAVEAEGTAPITLAYQWYLDGASISGATLSTSTSDAGDVGRALTVGVVATNAFGASAEAISDAVTLAAPDFAAPGVVEFAAGTGAEPGEIDLTIGDTLPDAGDGAVIGDGEATLDRLEVDIDGAVSTLTETPTASAVITVTTAPGATVQAGVRAVSDFGREGEWTYVEVTAAGTATETAPVYTGGLVDLETELGVAVSKTWSDYFTGATSYVVNSGLVGPVSVGPGNVVYSGTPTVAGAVTFSLTAINSAAPAGANSITVTFRWTVVAAQVAPFIKSAIPEGIFLIPIGGSFDWDFTQHFGGTNLVYTTTGLSAPFAVSAAGRGQDTPPLDTPITPYTFTVTATNSLGSTTTADIPIGVIATPPAALTAADIVVESIIRFAPNWRTPALEFPNHDAASWHAIQVSRNTPDANDLIPDGAIESVIAMGDGTWQLFMTDPAKRGDPSTQSPRTDWMVWYLDANDRFRVRVQAEEGGPWSGWSPAITVPPVLIPEVTASALPAAPRTKAMFNANVPGSQGQQYQRCRTWNLGIIDPTKRGWIISFQDENGLRFAKNGNAGGDGDPVLWGHPRLDGCFASKSGGLYLNTDDNAGAGLAVILGGVFRAGGFGTVNEAAGIGPYVADGTLNWAKRVEVARPSGPGPYVSGSSGPRRAWTEGNGTTVRYFGNGYDRQGNAVARRPQVHEQAGCTVFKTTKALLDADLAHAAGTKAWVYADSTASNRAVYTKSGTSGSGSWTKGTVALTDAQRPIYAVEQHGERADNSTVTYQALFRSLDAGLSYEFVRELPIATFASGKDGIYFAIVAPNGDLMLVGKMGAFLFEADANGAISTTFTRIHTREVSVACFHGGSSTTVSGAYLGDASANSNGGVYATANVRTTAFAKPNGNAGLPANFNVYDMAVAPSNQQRILVNTDGNANAYLSTNGARNFAAVSCATPPGEEGFRFSFGGAVTKGHSGFLFCPTDEQKVAGWTFQTVCHSINAGASFQGTRAQYMDGLHVKGVGTGPLTGTDPWKRLVTVSQDSLVATQLDGMNWLERCSLGTGVQALLDAIAAAGGGSQLKAASGAAGILLPNNRVICAVNRNSAGQPNVMMILHERQADGKYPNYLIRNLDGKKTRAIHSAYSLADPGGYAFLGRWGIGNLTAAPGSITFDDHGGHEFIGQMLSGGTQVSYWADFASGKDTGSNVYISNHAKGLNGQGTAWHTTPNPFPCRCICIDPHTPERILYVAGNARDVIREVKRVGGNLVDATLKDGSGNAVNLRTLILAAINASVPGGGVTLPAAYSFISQLVADPHMPGVFYALAGVHGVPNLWMTVDNGLTWENPDPDLPRTLWYANVHPLTGDLLLDSSMGRRVLPPPAGYPSVPYKGALSGQLVDFYGRAAVPNPPGL